MRPPSSLQFLVSPCGDAARSKSSRVGRYLDLLSQHLSNPSIKIDLRTCFWGHQGRCTGPRKVLWTSVGHFVDYWDRLSALPTIKGLPTQTSLPLKPPSSRNPSIGHRHSLTFSYKIRTASSNICRIDGKHLICGDFRTRTHISPASPSQPRPPRIV